MNIGVGLPTTMPGATGALVLEWARRADEGPFSSVAVLDRVAYESLEPFATLAAAAAVTSRVRLVTMIAIGPLRSTALLAKQAASVHALSGGRLTLGLAIGARVEDYEAAGVEHRGRGQRLGEQLAYSGAASTAIVSARAGGDRDPRRRAARPAFARMARYADGYVHGGGPPRAFARGRGERSPRGSTSGGPAGRGSGARATSRSANAERGGAYLRDYYAFTGPFAEKIAAAT